MRPSHIINSRLLKHIRPDAACHCRGRMLSNTAAVRGEAPVVVVRRAGKKVPKAIRKSMVADFVTKYRALNDGKFPGLMYTVNQVGGCQYVIRVILQELKHDSKLSSIAMNDSDSAVGPVAQKNDLSSAEEILDSVTMLNEIIENEDCGDLSENDVHSLAKLDNGISGKTVMPVVRTKYISDDDSLNQTTVDVGLESQRDDTCVADAVDTTYQESRKVSSEQCLAEKTLTERVVMDSAMEKSQFSANPSLPSKFADGCLDTSSSDANNASPPSTITDGYSRETTIQKTQENVQETLWGSLKSMASKFVNNWRKT